MSDNEETVAVPVELIRRMLENEDTDVTDDVHNDFAALLPKPKPRLVVVDPNALPMSYFANAAEWFDSQPDLLTLLDDLVDKWSTGEVRDSCKKQIRAALGVN